MRKNIAVLTGGESSEREVALWSSEFVVDSLKDNHDVHFFDFPKDQNQFLLDHKLFDVAIPVFHGPGGEDGVVQGFLKHLGVPFLFSDIEAHAIAMNKEATKIVVSHVGVNTPKAYTLSKSDEVIFDHPVVVKPINGGSTLGVTIVEHEDFFLPALSHAFQFADQVLVEDLIVGDEFTVAVIDEEGQSIPLPVIQIIAPDGFFDFESKYIDGKMAHEVYPAPIDEALTHALQQAALTAHQTIGVRHMSRSDFIVDANGKIWFLEINTIPGVTKNSLLPKVITHTGRDFGKLLNHWIETL